MSVLTIFIQKAIVQGICILFGALGEIMTEKSGNLNLGIPGIMYMGGISGLMGAFLYEKDNPNPNALVGVLISFLCAFACAAIGGLIYSMLSGYDAQQTIDFAVAASCLKHSIEHDFNHVSVAEVAALAAGNASGRVQR